MLPSLQSSELPVVPRAAGRTVAGTLGRRLCLLQGTPALRQTAGKLSPTEGAQMAIAVADGSHLALGRWHCVIRRVRPTAHLPREIFRDESSGESLANPFGGAE